VQQTLSAPNPSNPLQKTNWKLKYPILEPWSFIAVLSNWIQVPDKTFALTVSDPDNGGVGDAIPPARKYRKVLPTISPAWKC
jgi:hypothetical protein